MPEKQSYTPALSFGDPESIRLRDSSRPPRGRHSQLAANSPITSPWRISARNLIKGIILANAEETGAEIRKMISAAYPFGERKYTPYKIWCEEVRLQCDFYKVSRCQS